MVSYAIGHSFNKGGFLLLHDDLSCFLGGSVNGKDVVAIDTDSGNAIGGTSGGDTVTSILVIDGRRDSVHVITAVEKCLATESCSKVQRSMEVTFGRGTFTEVSDCNTVITSYSEIVAST